MTIGRISRDREIRKLEACFAHFGAVCVTRQPSLSAISTDGSTVAVAMWEDEFGRDGDRITYQSRYRQRSDRKLIANLNWARVHCNALVRVVVVRAEDVQANPRTIEYCRPNDELIMRITHLDSKTGMFRAESLNESRTLVG